jgi:replicative DNA helicase
MLALEWRSDFGESILENLTIYTLDLDYDFIMHLAVPDSFQVIRDEHISKELLEDEVAIAAYEFQIEHQREHGKPASGSVLEHELKEQGVFIVTPQSAIGDLIQRLRERYANNKGREAILQVTQQTISDPARLAQAMLEEGRRLHNLLSPHGTSVTADDYERAIARYHKKVAAGRGPSLGFDDVDDYFYGQHGLTFMVGAPKSFKSWFTIKAVLKNIEDGRFPYLYSLELPAEETDMRLRCMKAKVPYWKYLQNSLDKDDQQAIEESSEILASWGQYIIEKPKAGDRGVDTIIQRARDSGADCIFIDQLQYIENRRGLAVGATNDTKDYFDVINHLRDYSDNGPIWTVHQFNRSILNSEGMPEMQQIKASSAVEECATLVLGLWANKEMKKSNMVQLGTLTSRNYGMAAWEAQIRMRTTCGIQLLGRVEE